MIKSRVAYMLKIQLSNQKRDKSLKSFEEQIKQGTYKSYNQRLYNDKRVAILKVNELGCELLLFFDMLVQPELEDVNLHQLSEWSKILHGSPYNLVEVTKKPGRLFTLFSKELITLDDAEAELLKVGLSLEEIGVEKITEEPKQQEKYFDKEEVLATVRFLLETHKSNSRKRIALEAIEEILKPWK